jgi:hypothetical protein
MDGGGMLIDGTGVGDGEGLGDGDGLGATAPWGFLL